MKSWRLPGEHLNLDVSAGEAGRDICSIWCNRAEQCHGCQKGQM